MTSDPFVESEELHAQLRMQDRRFAAAIVLLLLVSGMLIAAGLYFHSKEKALRRRVIDEQISAVSR